MNTLFNIRIAVPALFLFFLAAPLGAQCDHPDYAGLENFYSATIGDEWDDNSGWLNDCEPCAWKGVGCDENQRVVSLVLRGNGLAGTLPEDFAGLPLLRLINLGYNEVAGGLPASLFELDSLRDVYLTGNRLTGNFPPTFGSRPLLTKLRIANNLLSGELPGELADFPNMSLLALDGNNFTGGIPHGLGDLTSVFAIDLSNNDLAGCFPDDMLALCGNTRIRFGGNKKLSWEGDFSRLCENNFSSDDQVGAPCDDGNPNTGTDLITEDCLCGGSIGTGGLLEANPAVAGFTEIREPGAERVILPVNPPVLPPTVNPAVSRMTAFPNPLVGGTLNVRLPEALSGAEVRLLSLTGREITGIHNVASGTSINVPVLQAGVYLLEAVSGVERSVVRIIVQ